MAVISRSYNGECEATANGGGTLPIRSLVEQLLISRGPIISSWHTYWLSIIDYLLLGHWPTDLSYLLVVIFPWQMHFLPSRLDLTVIDNSVVPLSTSSARLCDIFSKFVLLTSRIWSPRFRPPSYALEPFSTFDINIPQFWSTPPAVRGQIYTYFTYLAGDVYAIYMNKSKAQTHTNTTWKQFGIFKESISCHSNSVSVTG